jgi:CO/xanthine dehydrogenase Mo-binding subunit
MTTAGDKTYQVIGTRPIRPDGVDKVTGRAQYGADVRLTGMLYGAMLRSPHAHARILSIDTSQAEALPGVRAVVTGADLPALEDKISAQGESSVNLRYQSNNIARPPAATQKGGLSVLWHNEGCHLHPSGGGKRGVRGLPAPTIVSQDRPWKHL